MDQNKINVYDENEVKSKLTLWWRHEDKRFKTTINARVTKITKAHRLRLMDALRVQKGECENLPRNDRKSS